MMLACCPSVWSSGVIELDGMKCKHQKHKTIFIPSAPGRIYVLFLCPSVLVSVFVSVVLVVIFGDIQRCVTVLIW